MLYEKKRAHTPLELAVMEEVSLMLSDILEYAPSRIYAKHFGLCARQRRALVEKRNCPRVCTIETVCKIKNMSIIEFFQNVSTRMNHNEDNFKGRNDDPPNLGMLE